MHSQDYWQTPQAAARYVRSQDPAEEYFDLLRASENLRFDNVLDAGAGSPAAALYFAFTGKETTTLGPESPLLGALEIDRWAGAFSDFPENRTFNAIWMANVLNRTLDVGQMLRKAARLLSPNGWLMVLVPPYQPRVSGGRLYTGWNLGQLIHVLLVAGYNVRYGHFVQHGGSLCAFVQKGNELVRRMPNAHADTLSDVSLLEPINSSLWPMPVHDGFDGRLDEINWFPDFNWMVQEDAIPVRRMFYPPEAFQSECATLSDGYWQNSEPIAHRHLVYGPCTELLPGAYEARWNLDWNLKAPPAQKMAVDVAIGNVVTTERRLTPGETPKLRFEHRGEAPVEFRIYADGTLAPAALRFGGVSVVRI